jgi:general secretion pathway protein D
MRLIHRTRVPALLLAICLLTACTAGRAFRKGEGRAQVADWDAAVTYYRQAVQADPNKAEYRIALERAMLNASRVHFDNARQLEAKDQLDAALLEYRKVTEFDPSNRQASDKVIQLDRTIRERIEAARPRPPIAQLREQARQAGAEPLLNPSSNEPIRVNFTNASLRDILTFLGNASGINVTFDTTFQDRPYTVSLNTPFQQALNVVLTANTLFYAVLDEHTIVVAQDNNANRLKYERQVIQSFPVSYADATELATMLTQITRTTTAAVPPIITPNKTPNTITVRATSAVMDVIAQVIQANDKPRAEVTIDVEILEVNRTRVKQYGLNLSQYQIGAIFSPDQAPPGAAGAPTGGTAATVTTTDSRPFNLNTISQGVSTADFYLTVPQAIVKFLETDSETKLLAKPQLRGSEGQKITFKVGTDEPYTQTAYSPIAAGGANVNPLTSYTYRTVGINLEFTPRVTDESDIIIDIALENSARGEDRSVGNGATAPSFITRNLNSRIRLRDGESNLLAGLLRDDDRKTLIGFPGLIRVPVLKDLFASNDKTISQTDIVMLLTPRIIRTHEYIAKDLAPIYVGTNQNFGLTGPPPLIAAPADATPAPGAPAQGVPPQGLPVPTVPSTGAPGLITTPPAPPNAAPPAGQTPAPPQAGGTQPTTLAPPAQGRDLTAAPTPGISSPTAQVTVSPPGTDVRVAGGPYTVPVYISGVSRLSTMTVTINFNPATLRVRTISEGSFLRQGGANVTFTARPDATIGRIDMALVRTGDTVGASGSGLLSAIIFDAVGSGTSQISVSGVATDPNGSTIPLQFVPTSVVVR